MLRAFVFCVAVLGISPVSAGEVLASLTCLRDNYELVKTGGTGVSARPTYRIRTDSGAVVRTFSHRNDNRALNRFNGRFCYELKREVEQDRYDLN